MKKAVLCCSLALLLAFGALPAQADPIVMGNANWYEFTFTGQVGELCRGAFPADPLGLSVVPSSGGNSQFAPAPAWTFNSALPVWLTVTDAFIHGDAFEIFDNAALIGSTPLVAHGGSTTNDPAVAVLDLLYSHAAFLLPAGGHSLHFNLIDTVGEGAGYFRTDAVPVPPTLILLGSGLLGLAGWRRFRKS
jgi:hypothetical protein